MLDVKAGHASVSIPVRSRLTRISTLTTLLKTTVRSYLIHTISATGHPVARIRFIRVTMSRGNLIVFEGLDRAGKSTQCEMLVEALQKDGLKVKHMRFPGTFAWFQIYMIVPKIEGVLVVVKLLISQLIHDRSNDANWPDDQQLPKWTERAGRSCNSFALLGKSMGSSVRLSLCPQRISSCSLT